MADFYEKKLLEKYGDVSVADYMIALKGNGKFSLKDALNIADFFKSGEQLIIFVTNDNRIAFMRIDDSGNINSPTFIENATFEQEDKKCIRIHGAGSYSDVYSPVRTKKGGKLGGKENFVSFLLGEKQWLQ